MLPTQACHGLVVDTGSPAQVTGYPKALAYSNSFGGDITLQPSSSRFRFGNDVQTSIGRLIVNLPTPIADIPIVFDVVQSDVPALLGLSFLDKIGCNALLMENKLHCIDESWSMPLLRANGHLVLR
jgi:hypothetical protein